ncbi:MAG TPA: sugar ABC transporter substrate-binding protein [Chloroflexota bacterium]|nr:sugar ABC transporter substrate-binding protein [Chloroflexota bacterium]
MSTRRAAIARLASTASAMGSVGVLAACAGSGTGAEQAAPVPGSVPDRPVTLSYLNFFSAADPQNILFPHALATLQKHYARVSVEQISTAGSGQDVMAKFQALASAGTPPDIAALNPQYVEPLRSRGQLGDLSPYIRRDAKAFQQEDFAEATLLRARKDGKWHAIPLQMGLWFTLYNATLYEQAGVSRPDATWSWDRLLEATRAVMARHSAVVGISMPPYELPVRGAGGDVLSKDEKKCLLDEPAALDGIQFNADLRQKHRVVPGMAEMGGQTMLQLFDSGRLASHIGDPGALSGRQRGKLGFSWNIASVPKGKTGRLSTVKGPSLVMTNDSKEKDTAWAWLLHYTSPEMQRFVTVEGKIVSARTSALKAFIALDEGVDKTVLLDMASIARPMPYVARYDEMDKEIGVGLDAAYAGEQPVKAAMTEVARKVNLLLTS